MSCKNKTSNIRCELKPLNHLQFCGKHAKTKNPRLWAIVNNVEDRAICIQKIWRGYAVRMLLKLAGPGVLNRKDCHNEEELITYDAKDKLHPFDYFSFIECKKIYWFDIRSIFQWSIEHLKPLNPYTKQEIDLETRKRLKECVFHREQKKLPIYHDIEFSGSRTKQFAMRWMMISQILEENLFIEIDPMLFVNLNRSQLWTFTHILRDSMLIWAKQHTNMHSRRNIYYCWIANCFKRQTIEPPSSATPILYYLSSTLLRILKDCKMPYDICFQILSARHTL